MALNSILFLLFLAAVVTVYYLLPQRFQSLFLLLASYVFYFWTIPFFGLLMPATTAVSYGIGRAIGSGKNQRSKKAWLIAGILFCLALLCTFKYLLTASHTAQLADWLQARIGGDFLPSFAAPLGISFYTLQIIGYHVDIYRGTVEAEKNVVRYALFVGFFAHITSGPIDRAGELIPQFKERHDFQYANLVAGCQRFLTGAFKKVVVGDALGLIVNGVYGRPDEANPLGNLPQYSGLILVAVTLLYTLQLYADFSGYTDMALGAAKMLGFTLRENFRAPYLATSMDGVWGRWHLSLTAWLRDYIYIPLGGNRKGFGRKLLNILLVFLISGLWHGNTVSFVLWGACHGLFRIGEEFWRRFGPKAKRPDGVLGRTLKRATVYTVWAGFFIAFNAQTLPQLRYVLGNMFRNWSLSTLVAQILYLASANVANTPTYYLLFFGGLLAGIFILALFDRRMDKAAGLYNPLSTYKTRTRWLLYWVMGLLTALFYLIVLTATNGSPSFIYENF